MYASVKNSFAVRGLKVLDRLVHAGEPLVAGLFPGFTGADRKKAPAGAGALMGTRGGSVGSEQLQSVVAVQASNLHPAQVGVELVLDRPRGKRPVVDTFPFSTPSSESMGWISLATAWSMLSRPRGGVRTREEWLLETAGA